MASPTLSILIATVGERDDRFKSLVSLLAPQVQTHAGGVEVLVYWNNFERPIAEIRQALVEEARGTYTCFVDDDDSVPEYYCDRIIEAIKSRPDCVGWRMQTWWNGTKLKPTYHSIEYDRWWDDAHGYYRDASHLNPVRRDIALRVPFIHSATPEDMSWAERVAPLLKSEEYIEDCMYFYQFNTADSVWRGKSMPDVAYVRPPLPDYFRYHPDCQVTYP